MKKLGELLVQEDSFEEILMGNQALVRAMVETKTLVVTSYPGSPTPEIATAIMDIPEAHTPFYFEFSVNEKVATEVAFGAALNGNLSCVFFKSVGLNVALDSFVQLGLLNIIGGMVVVVGDDPGANSSQNEQDNRNIYRMAKAIVLEPASPKEAYEYYKVAARLAAAQKTIVVLRLTTHVCHARQKISFAGYKQDKGYKTDFDTKNGPYIPLTVLALEMKRLALKRTAPVLSFIRESGLNRVKTRSDSRGKGIITSGLTWLSVLDALEQAAYRPNILKLGFTNPLDPEVILDFLKANEQVLILEELDDILENQIKAMAYDQGLSTVIIGKTDDTDFIGEFTPDKTFDKILNTWPEMMPAQDKNKAQKFPLLAVPERPAQMCPGCGHRSAFFAVKQALKKNDVTVADIGCHTLGYMPPYEVGQVLLCMGASPGIASGLSLNNTQKKVVAFLGDSTFFHAGLPGVINTIFNHHNITLIIMENGTTAMTGHQDHAGRSINIETLLKGLGIEQILTCDTYNQERLTDHVKTALGTQGISVVIARHPCMLKFTRSQQKKQGYVRKHISIDPSTCTRIHACVEKFGCPSFVRNPDQSVGVNMDLCIGDGSCRPSCPEQALGFERKEE
ncbi:MAG: indolepyruvate ferredoxin oxidoreductase subunit alpha [Proteobacteria bacterium]|nr:indolepyruvate ferredoxin oxidoreductase subunit alpha [Pseudomonadota bacterium]